MNKIKPAKRAAFALGAVLALGATASQAADWMSQDFMKPYEDTLTIGLGGIVNQFDTSLRLDGEGSRGSDINLENNGLKKNLSSFEGMLSWRFLSRHRIDVDYYTVSRTGSKTYSGDINIGGNDYPVGADVNIKNKYDFGSFDYRYSFVQTPEYEIAALVGIYGGKVTFDVNALGLNSSGLAYNKSSSTTLPLPLLGLSADWYLDNRTHLGAQAMGMKAEIGDVDGRVYQVELAGDYMLTRNLGLGARWVYTDIDATMNKSSFDGNVSWRANAFSLFAKLVF